MPFTDTYKISNTAYEALKKIRKQNIKEDKESDRNDKIIAKKKYHTVFENFNEEKFNEKISLEMYVYNTLLQNISENEKEYVTNLISSMLQDVKSIYEFINIEPKKTGFKNLNLESSKQELVNESQNIIDNHYKVNFFNLNKTERERKYKDIVVSMAHDIIESEQTNIDEAVEHAHKVVIIENLVYNLNFPYIIQHKIKEVLEDDLYNDFFNIEELNKSLEEFESKNRQLARIITASKTKHSI